MNCSNPHLIHDLCAMQLAIALYCCSAGILLDGATRCACDFKYRGLIVSRSSLLRHGTAAEAVALNPRFEAGYLSAGSSLSRIPQPDPYQAPDSRQGQRDRP